MVTLFAASGCDAPTSSVPPVPDAGPRPDLAAPLDAIVPGDVADLGGSAALDVLGVQYGAPADAARAADTAPIDASADDGGAGRDDNGTGDGGGHSDGGGGPSGDAFLHDGAGHRLVVELEPFGLTLFRGEQEVARSAPAPFRFGRVPAFDERLAYIPHLDAQGRGTLPPDLEWLEVRSATLLDGARAAGEDEDPPELTLELLLDGGAEATLQLAVRGPGHFTCELVATEHGEGDVVFAGLAFEAPPREGYYGLGESFDRVQRRGTVRAMQLHLAPIESGHNEAHVPIPLLVGTRGWGFFVQERRPGTFDVARLVRNQVSATFANDRLQVHLFADPDPLEVVARYTLTTGAPALPALWAFAPQQWRNEHHHADEVLADARAMRLHGIPGSCIWIDNPWQTGYNDFVFLPDRFPDPAGLIQQLHALGYRVVVWSTPYLHEDTGELYARALAEGLFVDYQVIFDRFGPLVDLTHPGAVQLWSELIGRVTDLGVEGFKLDYGEDVQIGLGLQRTPHRFHNGEDERTMHHGYQLWYHRPYADALGPEGGFVLSRAGTYGDQAITTTIWPGDLDSDFRRHGEDNGVGGLPAAIIGGLTLSASGYPLYASDTGGFRNGRPTSEVLMRWAAYSALHPVMQLGGGGRNHNPWDHDPAGEATYDERTLQVYRRFAELHMRLVPYAYSLARQARDTGRPAVRPFGLAFPGDGRHPDFAFAYGDSLLVAPSFDGRHEVEVPLPAGRWLDWFDGSVHAGPDDLLRQVPLHEVPLYLAEGGVVPLLRPGVDTLAPVSEPDVDSFATEPGALWARVWPGPQPTEFHVFDGSDLAARRTDAGGAALTLRAGDRFEGWRVQVEWRALRGEGGAPTGATDGAQELPQRQDLDDFASCGACWRYLPDSGQVELLLPAGDHAIELRP